MSDKTTNEKKHFNEELNSQAVAERKKKVVGTVDEDKRQELKRLVVKKLEKALLGSGGTKK